MGSIVEDSQPEVEEGELLMQLRGGLASLHNQCSSGPTSVSASFAFLRMNRARLMGETWRSLLRFRPSEVLMAKTNRMAEILVARSPWPLEKMRSRQTQQKTAAKMRGEAQQTSNHPTSARIP